MFKKLDLFPTKLISVTGPVVEISSVDQAQLSWNFPPFHLRIGTDAFSLEYQDDGQNPDTQ
jgi:hypothetical protein